MDVRDYVEVWLAVRLPKFSSSRMEINRFRETATGSVNTFNKIVQKTIFFKESSCTIRIPIFHSFNVFIKTLLDNQNAFMYHMYIVHAVFFIYI